jgi:hypothetical protein
VLLPGLGDFSQILIDRFELAGLKVVRNRVITLRLWLQLWDTQTEQILWESTEKPTWQANSFCPSESYLSMR